MWLVALAFLVLRLLLLLLSSQLIIAQPQPTLNTNQLLRAQTAILELYYATRANASEANFLELLLDQRLLQRVHRVYDYIRGWAENDYEELIDVQSATRFLFEIFLRFCADFINAEYDALVNVGSVDAVATLQASQVFHILSNWQCLAMPTNPIVYFELVQFTRHRLVINGINIPPFVQLSPGRTNSDRFYLEAPNITEATFSFNLSISSAYYFRPIARQPVLNVRNELAMLLYAQNTVYSWYLRRKEGCLIWEMLNNHLWRRLYAIAADFLARTNSEGFLRIHHQIIQLILLRRYFQFVNAEYQRHICHPAHVRHKTLYASGNFTILSHHNYRLHVLGRRIDHDLSDIVRDDSVLVELYQHITRISLQPAYAFNENVLSMTIYLDCEASNNTFS